MCCVGEIVRKLRTRLEVTSSNPRTAHTYILREKSRTCDLRRARVWEPPRDFQFFFDACVPPFSPGWYYQP
jgi:hypothetical protein